MKRIFLKPEDPKLENISKEIPLKDIHSNPIKELLQDMFETAQLEQNDGTKKVLVGLAAPQIGVFKRLILVDIGADGKGHISNLKAYINPKILQTSKEDDDWYEGCFSTGNIFGIVRRPTTVSIKAYDIDSKPIQEEYTGYVARIFQHEIDHLNGKTFITHINNPKDLHIVQNDQIQEYRNEEKWRNWPHKYTKV